MKSELIEQHEEISQNNILELKIEPKLEVNFECNTPISSNDCQPNVFEFKSSKTSTETKASKKPLYFCTWANCNKTFKGSRGLKFHMQAHNSEISFKCHLCTVSCASNYLLNKHLKEKHEERPYVCTWENCNKKLSTANGFKYHMQSHNGEKPCKCSICDRCFLSKSTLKRHLTVKHGSKKTETPFKCPTCNQYFRWGNSLQKHIILVHETQEKVFQCHLCNASFKSRPRWKYHLNFFHDDHNKPVTPKKHLYSCTWKNCNKKLSTASGLKYHMLAHNNKNRFKCSSCDQHFQSYQSLKYHLELKHDQHEIDETTSKIHRFVCTWENCNKGFGTRNGLEYHIEIHNNEKPFECSSCDMCFPSENLLNQHTKENHESQKADNKIKMYKCRHCVKKFLYYSTLKYHMRLHAGEKPYKCSKCDKKFSFTSIFKRHIKSHGTGKMKKMLASSSERTANEIHRHGHLIDELKNHCKGKEGVQNSLVNTVQAEHIKLGKDEESKILTFATSSVGTETIMHDNLIDKIKIEPIDVDDESLTETTNVDHTISEQDEEMIMSKKQWFPCTWENCNKEYKTPQGFRYHMLVHNKQKPFKCSECDKCFRSNNEKKIHLKRKHGPTSTDAQQIIENEPIMPIPNKIITSTDKRFWEVVCTWKNCNKKLKTTLGFQIHMRVHNKEKPFKCPSCDDHFRSKENVKSHMQFKHSFKGEDPQQLIENEQINQIPNEIEMSTTNPCVYVCAWKNCNKTIRTRKGFEYHMRVHNKEKPFKCSACDTHFRSKQNLERHVDLTHNLIETDMAKKSKRNYKCETCSITFFSYHHLNSHRRIHIVRKPHECSQCHKVFSRKDYLDRHLKMHLRWGTMPLQIIKEEPPIIQSSNEIPQQLVKSEHSNQIPHEIKTSATKQHSFVCTWKNCNKKLRARRGFQIHMRVHNNEKPFKCPSCDQHFRSKENVTSHMKFKHSLKEEDPLQLDESEQINQIPNEIETSTTEPNLFVCRWRNCNKKLRTRKGFQIHMRVHNKQKPFKCPSCDQHFRSRENVKSHIKFKHCLKQEDNDIADETFNKLETTTPMIEVESDNKGSVILKKIKIENEPKTDEPKYEIPHKTEVANIILDNINRSASTAAIEFNTNDLEEKSTKNVAKKKVLVCSWGDCNKSFTKADALMYHMRVHKGEKPYHCSMCDNSFRAKHFLTQHLKLNHNPEATAEDRLLYPCTWINCNKKLKTRNGLKYHMQIHNKDKPFNCSICDRGFRTKYLFKDHWRMKHPNITESSLSKSTDAANETPDDIINEVQSDSINIKREKDDLLDTTITENIHFVKEEIIYDETATNAGNLSYKNCPNESICKEELFLFD